MPHIAERWEKSCGSGTPQKFPDLLIFVGFTRGVGVGPQGEPGVIAAQHSGHSFDVHAVLEDQGGEGYGGGCETGDVPARRP